MTQHTPGRLKVAEDGSLGSIESESGMRIAQTFQTRPIKDASDHKERKANARRLVACWNWCEGQETEGLELSTKIGRTAKDFINEAYAKELTLIAQRDELLEALKHIEGVAMADEWRDLPEIAKHARAAIAKAEGTTHERT